MTELRAIMVVVVGVCALAAVGSVSPTVEHVTNVGFGVLFGLLGLAGVGYVGREVWRELRFRADMRALDRRDTARRTALARPAETVRGGGLR